MVDVDFGQCGEFVDYGVIQIGVMFWIGGICVVDGVVVVEQYMIVWQVVVIEQKFVCIEQVVIGWNVGFDLSI